MDRLEDLVIHGARLPFGRKVAVDEEMFQNVIDQMRISIPQEIKLAKEIQAERDRYVAQAHEEARQIIAQAREDAAKQLDEHRLRKEVELEVQAILKQAREQADQIRAGADTYAEQRLKDLAEQLEQIQTVVQRGVTLLVNRKAAESQNEVRDS